jgi:ribose transport system substrate-binding protein
MPARATWIAPVCRGLPLASLRGHPQTCPERQATWVRAVFATAAVAGVVGACRGPEGGATSRHVARDGSASTSVALAAPQRIGVSLLTKEQDFYRQLEAGLRSEAAAKGYQLLITSGDFDLARQQSEIENFIVQHVDAIIVCPVDSKGIGPAILRAEAAGIPVFTADIRADGVPVTAHVASDNQEGGRQAAAFIAKALGPSGTVGIIGQPEVQTGRDRVQAFSDALAKYPEIHIVAVLNGGGVRDRSLKAAQDMLQAHPDLSAIFAINDETALGALSAARARGKTARDFTIVGYDATPEAVAAIRGNTPLKADIAQRPDLIGAGTIDAIAAHFAHRSVDSLVTIPVATFDAHTQQTH